MKRAIFAFFALIILLVIHAIIPDSADPLDGIIVIIIAYAYGKWIEKKILTWRRNRI